MKTQPGCSAKHAKDVTWGFLSDKWWVIEWWVMVFEWWMIVFLPSKQSLNSLFFDNHYWQEKKGGMKKKHFLFFIFS